MLDCRNKELNGLHPLMGSRAHNYIYGIVNTPVVLDVEDILWESYERTLWVLASYL